MSKDNSSEEKEKVVHCNFLINKSIHTRMKYLAIEHSPAALDVMGLIKRSLDPQNILNPGKIISL